MICEKCGGQIQKLGLTPVQLNLLVFIKEFIDTKQYSPTQKEMADAMGCNVTNINVMISRLEEKGHIAKKKWQDRSIVVL